jgi:hypothetical protein
MENFAHFRNQSEAPSGVDTVSARVCVRFGPDALLPPWQAQYQNQDDTPSTWS